MLREIWPIRTSGRGPVELTAKLQQLVANSGIESGSCELFIRHTSASLLICENADPDVLTDLENWFASTMPDGDSTYIHRAEGPDDMPAHLRSVITQTAITLPFEKNRLLLGTWQGVFLWEHRYAKHSREVVVTLR